MERMNNTAKPGRNQNRTLTDSPAVTGMQTRQESNSRRRKAPESLIGDPCVLLESAGNARHETAQRRAHSAAHNLRVPGGGRRPFTVEPIRTKPTRCGCRR